MPHLMLVRHGIADDRELARAAGLDDDRRALTEDGTRKFRKAAVGLWRLVPELHAVLTSPLLRAVETAELLVAPFGRRPIVQQPELAPGSDWRALGPVLKGYPADAWIACVGHEPDLGRLAAWLLTGEERGFFKFKKGGAAALELEDGFRPAGASLMWLLTGAQLRHLGGEE